MPVEKKPWAPRWQKVGKVPVAAGGQAEVFKAVEAGHPAGPFYALKIFRPRGDRTEEEYRRRRLRVVNEVSAMLALGGEGVPKLVDDNSERAKELDTRLLHRVSVDRWANPGAACRR